jgi:hypothetical protein
MVSVLIAYLLLTWVAGVGLTFVSRLPWDLEGRLAIGVPLGLGTAALFTWLAAIPIGMSVWPVVIGAIGVVALIAACVRWTDWRARLKTEAAEARRRWHSLEALPLGLLLVLAAFFFIPFYSHALEQLPDGLHVGYFTMLGDWAAHLSLAQYFATARHLLPPENPWFAGTNLNYSFLPDFSSGMLTHLGVGVEAAMSLSSALLAIALVVVFYSTALRLTGEPWAAMVAALILFLGSGLGFLRIFDEVVPTDSGPFGWVGGLVNVIGSPPHEYTMDPSQGYQWLNPILAYVLPQRNTLFGWSLGLLALSLIWHGWKSREPHELLIAGFVVGLLPLFHANTYLALLMITGGLAVLGWRRWREWLRFFTPALAVGAPLFLMLLPPTRYLHSFLRVQLGWMASTEGHHDNILWFWFINTGLLIPLALIALLADRWGRPELRRFLVPVWLLFLIPNVLILQPWDWDNTKWLLWWAIPASMLAGVVIVRLARLRRVLAPVAALLVLVQVASGSLDLDRAWQGHLNVPQLLLLDNEGLALAAWTRWNTPPDAVVLTSWAFNHPVRVMGGRVLVMSGLVSLWTTGIDYRERRQDVLAMYQGDLDSAALLRRYHVGYVVIGPDELKEIGANAAYFQQHYPMVYRSPAGSYQVFKVG